MGHAGLCHTRLSAASVECSPACSCRVPWGTVTTMISLCNTIAADRSPPKKMTTHDEVVNRAPGSMAPHSWSIFWTLWSTRTLLGPPRGVWVWGVRIVQQPLSRSLLSQSNKWGVLVHAQCSAAGIPHPAPDAARLFCVRWPDLPHTCASDSIRPRNYVDDVSHVVLDNLQFMLSGQVRPAPPPRACSPADHASRSRP